MSSTHAVHAQQYIGSRIRWMFGTRWFGGEVVQWHTSTGYRIRYDDGDVEDVCHEQLMLMLSNEGAHRVALSAR